MLSHTGVFKSLMTDENLIMQNNGWEHEMSTTSISHAELLFFSVYQSLLLSQK